MGETTQPGDEWTRDFPTEPDLYWFCLDYSDGMELLCVYEGLTGLLVESFSQTTPTPLEKLRQISCWWKRCVEPDYPAGRPK